MTTGKTERKKKKTDEQAQRSPDGGTFIVLYARQ